MIVLRGGTVLTPTGLVDADVAIDGGHVVEVGPRISGGETYDAAGALVGPGLVDLHTHLREPGQTWKEDVDSGTAAAAAGGFTAVVAMPNTDPAPDTPDLIEEARAKARGAARVELAHAGALTRGRAGVEPADIEGMYRCGVRVFTDDGDSLLDDALTRGVMERIGRLAGAVLAQHAEDPALAKGGHVNEGPAADALGIEGSPDEAEVAVVSRDLGLLDGTGARYHVQHVSSAPTVRLVEEAKRAGQAVTAEVTPHHLALDESSVATGDTNLKMYPPLRSRTDRESLVEAAGNGVIDAVATDHAPHLDSEKAVPFAEAPRGVIGLETAASVAWGVLAGPLDWFRLLSIAPARIAGLVRHGRPVTPGSPANLVVFDPARTWVPSVFASKSANSPFLGTRLQGRVLATFHEGGLVHGGDRG